MFFVTDDQTNRHNEKLSSIGHLFISRKSLRTGYFDITSQNGIKDFEKSNLNRSENFYHGHKRRTNGPLNLHQALPFSEKTPTGLFR